MYENYFFDLYGTLVDIRTDERKPSLCILLQRFINATLRCVQRRRIYSPRLIRFWARRVWRSSFEMSSVDFLRRRVFLSLRRRLKTQQCCSACCLLAASRGS